MTLFAMCSMSELIVLNFHTSELLEVQEVDMY